MSRDAELDEVEATARAWWRRFYERHPEGAPCWCADNPRAASHPHPWEPVPCPWAPTLKDGTPEQV